MRVFVAGASGAIGTRLVAQLVDAGHEVVGTYNSPAHAERVRSLGGSCTVESAPLKGTMIHIEIPVQRATTKKPRVPELVGEMS